MSVPKGEIIPGYSQTQNGISCDSTKRGSDVIVRIITQMLISRNAIKLEVNAELLLFHTILNLICGI